MATTTKRKVNKNKVQLFQDNDALDRAIMILAGKKALQGLIDGNESVGQIPPCEAELLGRKLSLEIAAIKIHQSESIDKPEMGALPWSKAIAFLLLQFPVEQRNEIKSKLVDALKRSIEEDKNLEEVVQVQNEFEIDNMIHFWKQELHHKLPPKRVKGATRLTTLGVKLEVG